MTFTGILLDMKQFITVMILTCFILPSVYAERQRYARHINLNALERVLIDGYAKFDRKGDKLVIKLDTGDKIYQDVTASFGKMEFRVVDVYHLPFNQSFALINVQTIPPYSEFINLSSGKIIPLTGHPVFSFDGRRFIETTLDLEAGEYNNTIRVFTLNNKEFVPEWTYTYKRDSGPSNPVWLNNTEFTYYENSYRNSNPTLDNLVLRPVIVKYRQGKWSGPQTLH